MNPQKIETTSSKLLWNPYVVGASLGVLSWLAFGVVNQPQEGAR